MDNHIVHKTVLLQTLISLLSEEGINVNTAAALNIEKVLLNTDLTVFNTFSKLKFRIVPILSRNKEEQGMLYKLFDTLDETVKSKEDTVQLFDTTASHFIYSPRNITPESWLDQLKKKAKTAWFWASAVAVTAIVAAIVIWSIPSSPRPSFTSIQIVADKPEVVVGDTVRFTAKLADTTKQGIANIEWKLPDTIIQRRLSITNVFHDTGAYSVVAVLKKEGSTSADTATYSVGVLCEPPPAVMINKVAVTSAAGKVSIRKNNYIPQFTNPSKDSAKYKYRWYVNNQLVATDKILNYKSKSVGNNEIKLVVDCKGIHCSADSLSYTLSERLPFSASVTGDGPLSISKTFNRSVIDKALFWLLFIVVIPGIIIYRLLKPVPKKERVEQPAEPEEPYSIQFNNQEHTINTQKEITQLADILRKRQVSDVYKLNIRKTIQTTVKTGGLPTLAFIPLTRPSDYLIFVESNNDNSHVERLFKYLIAKLESEQVNLTIYEYRKEPLFLNNERLNHFRIPLDRIAALYPERTLLIFGDSKNFVLPLKGTLKPWVTGKLNAWNKKIIVTPSPKNDWDKKEQLLITSNFTIIPADLNANTIVEKIINGTIDNQLEATFNIPATYSTRLYNFQELEALKEYLGNKPLLRWICSLAVYPTIDWNLTLAIGNKLEQDYAQKGQPTELVNYANLLKLGRISWLQDGMITDTLRIDMLQYLDNETEALARQTLLEQLAELEDKISATSLIKREFDVHKTINQFLIHAYQKKSPAKKEEAFIREIIAENQLDGAHDIYLNSSADTLLKNPFSKTKSVNIKQYFNAVNLKRKLIAAAAMMLTLVLFLVILKMRVGDDWYKVAPSSLTFHVNKGNATREGLIATLYTGDSTLIINLDQDTVRTTQLLVKDTTRKSLLTITNNTGQLYTQDSFRLNSKNYTIELAETFPVPVNIFYKNASDTALVNAVEDALPTSFDVTIGQQNFSDTALRITYASAQQKKDAALVQTIAATVLSRAPALVEEKYTTIKSTQYNDTSFEALPIAIYITSKETCTPVNLPNSMNGIWKGTTNNREVEFNNAKRLIKYSTGDNKTFGSYSINEVCLRSNGVYRIITGTTSGYRLFFARNTSSQTFDLALCPSFYKTKEELYRLGDDVCGRYDRMQKEVPTRASDTAVNKDPITSSKDSVVSNLSSFTPALRSEYQRLYSLCTPGKDKLTAINNTVDKIVSSKSRYELVSDSTGVPWYVIGILHNMEGSLSFSKHLVNGDPLTARTVHVPKGRPTTGTPPFTWEESAIDAIEVSGFSKWSDWSVPGILYSLEKFNGPGYRKKGINSPYLWAGSNNYTSGKFTADGLFDPSAVSKLLGAGVLLKVMDERNLLNNKAAQIKY